MGSKHRLLPWIYGVLRTLNFETAADPFVGSGCVAYLLKAMGKRVIASDFLNFPTVLAVATVQNDQHRIDKPELEHLLAPVTNGPKFIEDTFDGIFFTRDDLRFLDRVSANVETLERPEQQAHARAALIGSGLKKQPRGVFTVSGDLSHYDDGRRDLRLWIEEPYRAFSDRKTGIAALYSMFGRCRRTIIVWSYSSNGFPDLNVLRTLLGRH